MSVHVTDKKLASSVRLKLFHLLPAYPYLVDALWNVSSVPTVTCAPKQPQKSPVVSEKVCKYSNQRDFYIFHFMIAVN